MINPSIARSFALRAPSAVTVNPTPQPPPNPAPQSSTSASNLTFGPSRLLQRVAEDEEPIQLRTGRLGDDRAMPEEEEKMRKGDPQAKLAQVGYQPPWLAQLIQSQSIR